jgi:hypothetical protein
MPMTSNFATATERDPITILRDDLGAGRVDFSDPIDPDGPTIGPVHPGAILRSEWLEPLGGVSL